MKKIFIIIAAIFSLALIPAPSAFASEEYYSISDMADLLTEAQWEQLNERAEAITEKYQCEIVVVTVENIADFGYFDIDALNNDIYMELGYGYGVDKSCLILCLSMAGRDYSLVPYGYAITAFTKRGIDVILDEHVLPLLGQDKYYEAFSTYLDKSEEFLKLARDGTPFGAHFEPEAAGTDFILMLAVVILLPALIAFIVCAIWKSQMKTAKVAREADNYIPAGGFRLTEQSDMFLYKTTTRRRVEKSSSSSSSSSSGSSSGRSGKF